MTDLPDDLVAPLRRLLEQAGAPATLDLEPLAGGGNNRVFRVSGNPEPLLLKVYFRHPGDPRDRLRTECSFLRFASEQGLRQVPRPVAADLENGLGLYEFCPGRKLTPGEVDEDAVGQAVVFCLELSRCREHGRHLAPAAESCFSFADHLAIVDRRLERLRGSIAVESAIDREATAFVRETVIPAWQRLRERTERDARAAGLPMDQALGDDAVCLSPSDFGFHNALRDDHGILRFLDFEYAGWDDPAKMVCDFFCQPAVPVPAACYDKFVSALAAEVPGAHSLRRRTGLLLPVHQVKWVALLLNEFLPVGDRRRSFAQPGADREARKRQQLEKARHKLHESGACAR